MFSVVATPLTESELIELLESIELPEAGRIDFKPNVRSFAGALEATVVASVVAGGSAILVAFINGLFKRWVEGSSAETSETRRAVVVTFSSRTIRISAGEYLPAGEIEDEIIEIRLEEPR